MTRSLSWGVPFAALALTLAYAPGPVTMTAAAAPRAAVVAPGCYGGGGLDLDGDDKTDVPVGEPDGDVGKIRDAGVVEVSYGCGARATQRLTLPHPRRGDQFGAALAAGYYSQNYVPVRVLFVGAPLLDVKGHKNAGGVAEFHDSSAGLTLAKLWTQDTKGVPGKVQTGAHFGAALSLSNWNEERFHLRIGEPGLNVGHDTDTGAYVTLSWNEDPEDPPAAATKTTLSDLGVKAQDGDLFGSSFAQGTSFRVGAPGRRVQGHAGAGAVLDTHDGSTLIDQATPGIAGAPGKGNHFGATLSGNWIGVPGESLGSASQAGAVQYWDPDDPASATSIDQGTAGVPGDVGADHRFGSALASDDDSAVYGGPDVDYLFVGAPGDRSGDGSVTVLRMPRPGRFAGDAVAVPPPSAPGGHFGTAVAESGYAHLVAGAPDSEGGQVLSYLLPSTASGAPTLETAWTQSGGGTRGAYGASLSGPELDAES